ncbi:PepSY domain-containing protein [Novosphingobium sp. ST904]|uniref:PepSY domain-containing protein n=1 Tax=Novosphingobium sp. ST904 TaxID=1684385 RepID=UPI002101B620|nr:PepSY domain-containing protein [Novosphingobium sp. ST904]
MSGLALLLLTTALPWTDVWARGLQTVRFEMGWIQGPQQWKGGAEPLAVHHHDAMEEAASAKGDRPDARRPSLDPSEIAETPRASLDTIVLRARNEHLPAPVIVQPPGAPNLFGPLNGQVWTITTQSQNRPQVRSVSFDPATGIEVSRTGFADKHVIDRVVGVGIAWHEGQLFGWINQLIGVLTAAALFTLAVSGFLMWRRRKPIDTLGAPPPAGSRAPEVVAAAILFMAALLPLLAASLILLWTCERLLMPRLPSFASWLGSGLIDQSQKMTVAARATAEKKAFGHRS